MQLPFINENFIKTSKFPQSKELNYNSNIVLCYQKQLNNNEY